MRWRRATKLVTTCVCMLLLPLLLACAPDGGARGTRVVLITLDTMRLDALDGGPDDASPMPLLEHWSRRGLVMERHYAASSTTQPTHASLLTGLQPWEHGVTRNGQVLASRRETLAEIFAANGYRTGAVVASFPLYRGFGFAQGFERFDDAFEVGMTPEWSGRAVPGGVFYSLADSITDKALAMVDELTGPRQFFWFHYFDLHEPYGDLARAGSVVGLGQIYASIERKDPAVPRLLDEAKQKYEADARRLDVQLDRLLQRLTRDADRVDTHVFVVSDHGESFGEDGSIGHGKRLSDALIHVPCFLISPAVAPARLAAPIGSIDVPATLLALAGVPGIAGSGRDLTQPLPEGRSVFGMRRTFETPFDELRLDGLRHRLPDHLFYVADRERVTTGDENAVSSRSADPDAAGSEATRDAAAVKARSLFALFEEDLSRADAGPLLDASSRAALEALGYVQ